jgi:hypothetical protein
MHKEKLANFNKVSYSNEQIEKLLSRTYSSNIYFYIQADIVIILIRFSGRLKFHAGGGIGDIDACARQT